MDNKKYVCNGRGFCLVQKDNNYIKNEDYFCENSCKPINCPNFKYCKNFAPQCILDCHNNNCMECNMAIYCHYLEKEEETLYF
jgi:hypothetical protein